MIDTEMVTTADFDALDTQIARCIQISPRVPFREIGEVLDVAEQTVARRYRRMRRDGLLRVTAGTNPWAVGDVAWLVRVRCRPEGAEAIAAALAARDDVSWVSIYEGGWEVVFNLRSAQSDGGSTLLRRTLPKAAPVLDVAPASVLHTYIGGASTDWGGWRDSLTDEQVNRLAATRLPQREPVPTTLNQDDRALVAELVRDGRIGYSDLARTLGSTPGKVARHVERLVSSGVLYFDVDLAEAALGRSVVALWLTVEPRHLADVGAALAAHPDIPFAAAITGRANLSATVMVPEQTQLYGFVTGYLAGLDGITGYELAPLLSRVKNAGALVRGDRLAPPQISPNRRRASSRSAL